MIISLLQTALHWENVEQNLSHFDKILKQTQADLIVLPEMFSSGFTMNIEKVVAQNNAIPEWMLAKSSQKNALLMGSYIFFEKGHYFNRLSAAFPDGNLFHYDKRHLFRMAGEDKVFSPGKSKILLEWMGFKICPLVCYDLRFPVWSRNHEPDSEAEFAYDLLVYVANWPKARIKAWDILLRARAIENLAYVAAVNRTGIDGNEIFYSGHSAIVDPKGEPLAFSDADEEILTSRLSKSDLVEYRNKFPAQKDADKFLIL
jgi:predicted amidohydrolase